MDTRTVTDQLNRRFEVPRYPKRIISLVPSQTEYLIETGIGERLVARTHFCIHPKETVRNIPRIGGTKKIRIEAVKDLKPDLIIANKEENEKEQIELLSEHFPVWISDIKNPVDAIAMMEALQEVCSLPEENRKFVANIRQAFASPPAPHVYTSKKVLYVIWKDPWMVAGHDTFIHSMLNWAGLQNACKEDRYPVLEEEAILALRPDILLLSSEPYPFGKKHQLYWKEKLPNTRTVLADGEMFSWYGSRMALFPQYLMALWASLQKE